MALGDQSAERGGDNEIKALSQKDICFPSLNSSIYKVARELKREGHSIHNCIHSILQDAGFISEIRALYPSLPLLANLRCGLWYTPAPDATCYFKSTDGHNGNWSFSLNRLNWNVCETAASAGGVISVDATRKGKRFPDAMTKTIPIWAAVINRAVARIRATSQAASPAGAQPSKAQSPAAASPAAASAAEPLQRKSLLQLVDDVPDDHQACVVADRAHTYGRQLSLDTWLDDEEAQSVLEHAQHALTVSNTTSRDSREHDALLSSAACSEIEGVIARVAGHRDSHHSDHDGPHHHHHHHHDEEHRACSYQRQKGLDLHGDDDEDDQRREAAACSITGCHHHHHHHDDGGHASSCLLSDSDPVAHMMMSMSMSMMVPSSSDSCGTESLGDAAAGCTSSSGRPSSRRNDAVVLRPHSLEDLVSLDPEYIPPIPIAPPIMSLPVGSLGDNSCSELSSLLEAAVRHGHEAHLLMGNSTSTSTSSGSGSAGSPCSSMPSAAPAVTPIEPWDIDVHLPLWVSKNERLQIEERLEGFVDGLMSVGEGLVRSLAKVLEKPLRPLWVNQSSLIWVDQVAQPAQLDFTPLVLVSASQTEAHQRTSATTGSSYVYVPGAGDDEEAWAAGLTPELFWQHYRELLEAGPDVIHATVESIIKQAEAARASAEQQALQLQQQQQQQQQAGAGGGGLASLSAVPAPVYVPLTDEHHLMPSGVVAARPANLVVKGAGLYAIGATGLYLGAFGAGAAPDVWCHVGAVLNCGTQEHPSMASEPKWDPSLRMQQLMAAPSAPGVAGAGGGAGGGASSHAPRRRAPRYLWLPVTHCKVDRTSLLDNLAAALDFISYHLHCGRGVLIHDVTGLDTSVCIAVAMLLACFSPGDLEGGQAPKLAQPFMVHESGWVSTPAEVTKESVRQRLALVSSCYPTARPTRGMLKQAYNFLCT